MQQYVSFWQVMDIRSNTKKEFQSTVWKNSMMQTDIIVSMQGRKKTMDRSSQTEDVFLELLQKEKI